MQPQPADSQKKPWAPVLTVAIVLLAVCCFGCIILAAILFPVFAQARQTAQATSSISNLKAQALAMQMYAADHNDRMPLSGNWMDVIDDAGSLPYLTNPISSSTKPGYAMSAGASGINLSLVLNPEQGVATFEASRAQRNLAGGPELLMDPKLGPRRRVGYSLLDGSAKRMDATEAAKLEWEPKSRP